MTDHDRAAAVLAQLEADADPTVRADLADRYGIHAGRAFGVPMRRLTAISKPLAPDHALAAALWNTGSYEARTIAALVDDPQMVTVDQMQRWVGAFDNWAIVDTTCFKLFDRAPAAWDMVEPWALDGREFVRRAGFALLWALALHDTAATDHEFIRRLHLFETCADDKRHLVTKALTMAMRAIAKKRPTLLPDVVQLAERLVASDDPNARRAGRPIVKAFGASS